MVATEFGVREVRIQAFRTARSVTFAPGRVCALVGGPSVGKSNVLAAIWTLLQQGRPAPVPSDVSAGPEDVIRLAATLAGGARVTLETHPPVAATSSGRSVPVLLLPASRRSGQLIAEPTVGAHARRVADTYFVPPGSSSSAAPATALVDAVEAMCRAGEHGLVLLIEEPELFLRPQAQRYLYRLLRGLADQGNQVLYSTHAPAFLNVGRLDELALLERTSHHGTMVVQPEPLPADDSFRALSEVDAERGELLLARAVLLVEGRTEKLAFPFVFKALGHDVDREAVTIVECGGKPNMAIFIRICQAARIPFLAVYDSDARPRRKPGRPVRGLNAEIAQLAGPDHTVMLSPDFEAVAHLHGHRHKPARAWQRFSAVEPDQVPTALRHVVETVVEMAR
jgi:hypothetical protein